MIRQFFFAQKAFILNGNEVLLIRKSADDPNQANKWEVPGGRMEFGEEVDAHLVREVKEEVGIEIVPGSPFHVWQWQLDTQR
ncbi:MAG: NUDIX domain-containing protein [Candidatus Binatia bacterium]